MVCRTSSELRSLATAGHLVKVTWAASAAAGGVLTDRCGYRATFLLTAALQGLGTALLLLLPGEPSGAGRVRAAELAKPLLRSASDASIGHYYNTVSV